MNHKSERHKCRKKTCKEEWGMNEVRRKTKSLGKENNLNTCVVFPNKKLNTNEHLKKKELNLEVSENESYHIWRFKYLFC